MITPNSKKEKLRQYNIEYRKTYVRKSRKVRGVILS